MGPSFANIYLRFCAEFSVNYPLHFKLLLYRIYANDAFCIFQNRAQAMSFLQYLDQQHPNISFTHEFKDSNSVPFLGVSITHADNGFFSHFCY